MAGMNIAKKLIKQKRNKGRVIAKGKTIYEDEKFMIIEIPKDRGTETVFDYGTDIRFQKGIKLKEKVQLKIISEGTAEWQKT